MATTETRNVVEAARDFRRKVLERDTATRRQMAEAWRVVRRGIDGDVDKLLADIERRGIQSQNEVYRLQRYVEFRDKTEARIAAYTGESHRRVARTVEHAAESGLVGAEASLSAATTATMTRPSDAAVQAITGRLREGAAARRMATVPARAVSAVEDALIAGIGEGAHPRKIAREIRRSADMAVYDTQRIARTETLHAFREASVQTYQANRGVVQAWRWDSALDGRTCPMCWGMHGSLHAPGESFATHPNCRCSPLPVTVDPRELAGLGGAVREYGPTGEQAFARLPDGEKESILGPARAEAYRAGTPLSAMVKRTDHPTWGPGRALVAVRDLD